MNQRFTHMKIYSKVFVLDKTSQTKKETLTMNLIRVALYNHVIPLR